MENHHLLEVSQLSRPFSLAMLVYQRVHNLIEWLLYFGLVIYVIYSVVILSLQIIDNLVIPTFTIDGWEASFSSLWIFVFRARLVFFVNHCRHSLGFRCFLMAECNKLSRLGIKVSFHIYIVMIPMSIHYFCDSYKHPNSSVGKVTPWFCHPLKEKRHTTSDSRPFHHTSSTLCLRNFILHIHSSHPLKTIKTQKKNSPPLKPMKPMKPTYFSLVGGLEHFLFSYILGILIPTDYYFSEGMKPPTRYFSHPSIEFLPPARPWVVHHRCTAPRITRTCCWATPKTSRRTWKTLGSRGKIHGRCG